LAAESWIMSYRAAPVSARNRNWSASPAIVRYIGYTGLFLALACTVNAIAGIGDVIHYDDGGLIEWTQLSILLAALLMLMAAVRRSRPGERGLPLALSCLMAIATTRELDTVFDRLLPLPWAEWKLPAALLAAGLAATLWRTRSHLLPQIRSFCEQPACALFWAGLCAVAYAQMTGHDRYWLPLLQDVYVRGVKRINE